MSVVMLPHMCAMSSRINSITPGIVRGSDIGYIGYIVSYSVSYSGVIVRVLYSACGIGYIVCYSYTPGQQQIRVISCGLGPIILILFLRIC